MRRLLKLILRIALTVGFSYLTLLVTAWWADRDPSVAAFFGGHNIALQVLVTLPGLYLLLGLLPVLRSNAEVPAG